MANVSTQIYQVEQMRTLERLASERFGVSGDMLMQRAGKAAYDCLMSCWPAAKRIVVLCGAGNNGGDGYILAQIAHEHGLQVDVYHIGEPDSLRAEAMHAYAQCKTAGVNIRPYSSDLNLHHADVIVDALFGIGLHGDVKGEAIDAIDKLNQTPVPVFAIDIPSGLHADTGKVLGRAVKADVTITFIGLKLGLLTGSGTAHTGHLYTNDLVLPDELFSMVDHIADELQLSQFAEFLKPRPKDWHKGNAGHVLVVGGDYGYSGAPRMAAEAALRVGAGLVSVATRPEHAKDLNLTCPEIMCHSMDSPKNILPLLEKADVVIVGPGMGQTSWAFGLLKLVINTKLPLIVDADALNILAEYPHQRTNWILTPHPGEAARMLGVTAEDIQSDRLKSIIELQKKYEGICVLKGAGSLIMGHAIPALCHAGNPGMASAGMGDVLSGVIGGLVAQDFPLQIAAKLGVCLHATAGDLAAKQGERGMIATDLMPYLRELMNLKNSTL